MNKNLFVALIPARGGSKGIKKKNLIPLNGKPLIAWTIQSALGSDCIKRIFVSSDDNSILDIAKEYGVECINRPSELAKDTSSMESVVLNSFMKIEEKGINFEHLILLQPTSPLRNNIDIELACKIYLKSNADSLISVTHIDNTILKSLIPDKNGFLRPAFESKFHSTNRQELPQAYKPNGAIYIINKNHFLKNPSFVQEKTVMYEMEKEKSIDVDSIEDIHEIEKLDLI